MLRPVLILAPIFATSAILAIALSILSWSNAGPERTQAANEQAKTQMDIVITGTHGGAPVSCNSATQSKCTLGVGTSFTISIVPSTIPNGGYAIWQVLLDYGALLYEPAPGSASAGAGAEISWDVSLLPTRYPGRPTGKEGQIAHGDASTFFSPGIVSFQKTTFLTLNFNCSQNAGGDLSQLLSLPLFDFNAEPSGTTFVHQDMTTVNVPNTGSMTINCVTKDTDLDGCSDEAESGPFEYLGGQRDHLYFWDFYDVWTHPPDDPIGWERNKVLNIFDINAVGARFGSGPLLSKAEALAQALVAPTDGTSYHPAYDRGPIVGANAWDRGPPDASINIVDDILGIAAQFGHSCA